MAGPGDEMAAAEGRGRGKFRASHADREQVINTLKAAFIEGMLSKDEFDQRVGQAFGARTYAELAPITADLRVEPVAARSSELARPPGKAPVLRPGQVLAAATAVYASVWAFAFFPPWPLDSEGDPPRAIIFLVFSTTFLYLFISAITVGNMLAGWIQKRSGGRPAPGEDGR
jgi:uncharacterized protein DUF1707